MGSFGRERECPSRWKEGIEKGGEFWKKIIFTKQKTIKKFAGLATRAVKVSLQFYLIAKNVFK